MKPKALILAMFLFLGTDMAWAERQDEPIARHLFPPELVMRHYREIGLTDKQQASIRAEMKKAQNQFFDLQWDMEKATGSQEKLMRQDKVDEQQVLTQMDKILRIESRIKRTRLALLIRIKNLLTAEQKAQLNEFREQRHRMSGRLRPGFGEHRDSRPLGRRPEGPLPR